MASLAAVNEFVRVYGDPESAGVRGHFSARAGRYLFLWHYYNNAAFDTLAGWGNYKGRHHLYRYTRSIYNPVRRLVDFYSGVIYPGYLTSDGKPLPDGTPTAIPLPEDTPPELVAACGQLWQWSNWQTGKGKLPRYGAALGDVMIEVVDDVERGKVALDVVWPGLVADLQLDPYGNIKVVRIEYPFWQDNKTYQYARVVDSESVRTFRDDKPFGYGDQSAVYANPYGFVPACWIKHTEVGGDHGEPAVRNLVTIDELNSLAAHTLDQGHRILEAPILVSGENIGALEANEKVGPTASLNPPSQRQESIKLLRGGPGSAVATLRLDPGEALAQITQMLSQIETDHPELGMFEQLRGMSQVTGPGADRLFGDVQNLVNSARANYDTQSVKAFQMAIAIGGWRANRGEWGPSYTLKRQQVAFLPYDLDSYQAGDLDMEIMPRPLVPITEMERLEMERVRLEVERMEASVRMESRPPPTLAAGIADRLRVIQPAQIPGAPIQPAPSALAALANSAETANVA